MSTEKFYFKVPELNAPPPKKPDYYTGQRKVRGKHRPHANPHPTAPEVNDMGTSMGEK